MRKKHKVQDGQTFSLALAVSSASCVSAHHLTVGILTVAERLFSFPAALIVISSAGNHRGAAGGERLLRSDAQQVSLVRHAQSHTQTGN